MRIGIRNCAIIGLTTALFLAATSLANQAQRTRRSQRVRMQQVQVASPDGNVKLTILPNAERLTFTVTLAPLDNTTSRSKKALTQEYLTPVFTQGSL